MTEKEILEKEFIQFIGNADAMEKWLKVLGDAFWQSHNLGYCDSMANREMSGRVMRANGYLK